MLTAALKGPLGVDLDAWKESESLLFAFVSASSVVGACFPFLLGVRLPWLLGLGLGCTMSVMVLTILEEI